MTPANPTGTIAIPQWVCSHGLTLEELGLYTLIAVQHHYQERQPNPQQLATTTGSQIQKIKDLLNALVAKGLLVKGTTTYRLQFGTITITPPNGTQPTQLPRPAIGQTEHPAAQQLTREMAIGMPELAKALGGNADSIIPIVGETLDRGISPSQIRQAIAARTLIGVDNVPSATAHRLRGLVPQRSEASRQPGCPLHRGHGWHNCPCCKGEINEGRDPYEGREEMRPDRWSSAYPEARHLVKIEPVVE
jgi:hypothetical protein